jgi:hypothetical protein
MNGIHYSYAKAVSEERIRSASANRNRRRLAENAEAQYPLRGRLAHLLIRAGVRLSPQPLELVPVSRTAGC